MTEYWLISAPGEKTCQQTFDRLNQVIQVVFQELSGTSIFCPPPGNFQATTVYKLEVPHTRPEGDSSISPKSCFHQDHIGHLLLIQVGTLDQLVGLSDDLGKLDVFVEQVTRLLAVQ